MKRLVRIAVPSLLVAIVSAGALMAQGMPDMPPGGQVPGGAQQAQQTPRGPSPEMMARMQEGRLAMIKGALQMNEEQLRLWGPVEEQLRQTMAERAKLRAEKMQRYYSGDATPPSMIERMERYAERMAMRAERARSFLNVFKPFHASLSEPQKEVLGPVMAKMGGFGGRGGWKHGRHRGGHHMGYRRGYSDDLGGMGGMGGMGPGMGPGMGGMGPGMGGMGPGMGGMGPGMGGMGPGMMGRGGMGGWQ